MSIAGRGGYFLADKWVGGVQLTSKFEDVNRGYIIEGSRIDSKIFTVVPELYTRYYFFSSRFRPVAQVSAGYRFQSLKDLAVDLNQEYSDKDGSFQLGAALGLSYQVSKSFNLELMYSAVTYKAPKSAYSNSSSVTDGNLKLGVAYFF